MTPTSICICETVTSSVILSLMFLSTYCVPGAGDLMMKQQQRFIVLFFYFIVYILEILFNKEKVNPCPCEAYMVVVI